MKFTRTTGVVVERLTIFKMWSVRNRKEWIIGCRNRNRKEWIVDSRNRNVSFRILSSSSRHGRRLEPQRPEDEFAEPNGDHRYIIMSQKKSTGALYSGNNLRTMSATRPCLVRVWWKKKKTSTQRTVSNDRLAVSYYANFQGGRDNKTIQHAKLLHMCVSRTIHVCIYIYIQIYNMYTYRVS